MDDLVSRLLAIEREKREILDLMRKREFERASREGLIEVLKPRVSPRAKRVLDSSLERLLKG